MKRILRGGNKRDRPKSDAELGEMELTELPSPQSTHPSPTQEWVATATQLESHEEESTPPPSPQQSIHQGDSLSDNDEESVDSHLGSGEEGAALPSSTQQSTHEGDSIPENDKKETTNCWKKFSAGIAFVFGFLGILAKITLGGNDIASDLLAGISFLNGGKHTGDERSSGSLNILLFFNQNGINLVSK